MNAGKIALQNVRKKKDRRFLGCSPPFWIFLVILFVLVVIALFPNMHNGDGSPSYALECIAEFAGIDSVDQAEKTISQFRSRSTSTGEWASSRKFDNGQWVFGVCRDSHSSRHGGTVVVKDSRGDVRVFFGHVCGALQLSMPINEEEVEDLDGFYEFLLSRSSLREVTDEMDGR
jgi:hypothetical protein